MRKKIGLTDIILGMIIVGAVIGACIVGKKIFVAEKEYQAGIDIYDEVSAIAYSAKENIVINATDQSKKEENDTITTIEFQSAADVETVEKHLSAMNFDSLLEINQDVVGWITVPDTRVDYPILQGPDNDYYLRHAITGEWNKVGTPFMDHRNASDFSDRLTVVYGHYMENGTMFRDLHNYKGQKYYDEHKTAILYTPQGDYEIEFVAGVLKNVKGFDFTFKFDTDEAFVHYLNNWKLVSTFKSDIEISADDKYVVFSLCSYDVDNGRFFLLGRIND